MVLVEQGNSTAWAPASARESTADSEPVLRRPAVKHVVIDVEMQRLAAGDAAKVKPPPAPPLRLGPTLGPHF